MPNGVPRCGGHHRLRTDGSGSDFSDEGGGTAAAADAKSRPEQSGKRPAILVTLSPSMRLHVCAISVAQGGAQELQH